MGWKSTAEISREEAISLISRKDNNFRILTNEELEEILDDMGFGDDPELPYYGYNFIVGENK